VLIYPPRGRLLFATDFHGGLEDFRRVVSRYRERRAAGEAIYLLFAGDFIHGPDYSPEAFPEYLGDPHGDDAPAILAELESLMREDPGVRSLLGNHEHAHIGGPHTTRFHREPDEVEFLESCLGPDKTARAHALFRTFALAALTPCGVLFLHGAPSVRSAGFREVSGARLNGYGHMTIREIYGVPVIGELLWAKSADPVVAERFLERMAYGGRRPRVAVYGHDIIRNGFERLASNQAIVSTSFGLKRRYKTLCEIDLAGRYERTEDLRYGREFYPLYGETGLVKGE
jgi:hypothetical protein